ncbi:STAS domain-containing protein [Streptomyces sp. NPDC001941]|uniref:STAS domain-containing protein n=1 Tax=Streptomyces sp. NPDC001941 TaxID=3154659 RepID=UPI00332692D9
MTQQPPSRLVLAVHHGPATLTVAVSGELDQDTGHALITDVCAHLADLPHPPHDVRLDFRELTFIDSSGLSALLMVHRHTDALGATLHLDNRPGRLERMLRTTGVLDHLTAPPARATDRRTDDGDELTGAGTP